MNEIKTSPRGFPFDERTLQEIQDQTVPVLNAIGHLLPDNSRIFGVELPPIVEEGSEFSPGFIRWNGEFLPFLGGAYSTKFSIIEDVVERAFNVGTDQDPQLEDHPAYILRYAMPGDILNAESVHNFSDLGLSPKLLNYLHQGEVFIGTLPPSGMSGFMQTDGSGTVIDISFPRVRYSNYLVLGNFYKANAQVQGSFDHDIFDRTNTGFKIRIKNVTDAVTNLFFQYVVVPRNNIVNPIP